MNRSQTITQRKQPLIKKLAFLALLLVGMAVVTQISSCKSENTAQSSPEPGKVVKDFRTYPTQKLALPNGKLITAYVAKSPQEQTQGLSGVKESDLKDNDAMLFWYEKSGPRRFWMPNTYANLDIFFLTKDMEVIHVERNVQAHPGMEEPPKIAQTPVIFAHHVLELKASSALSKEIKIGMQLTKL